MSPFAPSLSLAAVAVLLFAIFGQAAQAASIEEHKRQKLIPFPRVGKRQALIPFPRTGKRSGSGAPGPPAGVGTVADFLRRLEREREAADAQPMSEGGAATEARITMKDLDRYLESTHQPRGRDEYGEYDPMALVVPALKNLIRRIEENERMK